MKTAFASAVLVLLLAGGAILMGQTPPTLSPCALAKDAVSYDQKTVQVRGTLSVHFEDFSLESPNCDARRPIWLAFGGDVAGIVSSIVNDNFRKSGVDLKIDGVSYGIKKDENFRRLYALIAARQGDTPRYRATATLSGVFLAAKDLPNELGGYGHFGCCHLLVITEVADVVSTPSANLNVRGRVLGPDGLPIPRFAVLNDILGGLPPQTLQASTDEKGAFEFLNSGPLLRIEVPKYRPLATPVEPGGPPVDLKLEGAQRSDWEVSPCARAQASSRIGFSMSFVLPSTMESEVFEHQQIRRIFVFPRGGSSAADTQLFISVEEGVGADNSRVLDSRSSSRRWIKDSAGNVVGIDSRGQDRNGGYWRTVSFGRSEIATYDLEAGRTTALLDRLLDSACISRR